MNTAFLQCVCMRIIFTCMFASKHTQKRHTHTRTFVQAFITLVVLCRTFLTIILFVCRGLIAGSFQGIYVYTPEVYPTTVRGMGLGIASSCGRVGGMIIPFIAQVRVNVHLAPNPPTHGRASQLSRPSGLCGCAVPSFTYSAVSDTS